MRRHNLRFNIPNSNIDVDVEQLSHWIAGSVWFESEARQEEFAHHVYHTILDKVNFEITMSKTANEWARIRRQWIKDNPPNHAGYYYCHIGGEWVHEANMDLEHITAKSKRRIDIGQPGWQNQLRPACRPHNSLKGSSDVESATTEIRPPDGEI